MDRAYVSNFFHIWFSTNPEHEIVFVFIWFAKLAEQFQVHNSGIYIALIILWDFWMVWTASSHFRVVLTSNDLILSSPCQENHKREMWTISDKKLNAFLAFLTLSWAELSRGFRLWSFQVWHLMTWSYPLRTKKTTNVKCGPFLTRNWMHFLRS